jgi:hypothetical protein
MAFKDLLLLYKANGMLMLFFSIFINCQRVLYIIFESPNVAFVEKHIKVMRYYCRYLLLSLTTLSK